MEGIRGGTLPVMDAIYRASNIVEKRSESDDSTNNTTSTTQHITPDRECLTLTSDQLIISRTALTISITICVFITLATLLILSVLLFRSRIRRHQRQQAKAWGRQSRHNNRISMLKKEVDDEFRRKFSGCLVNVVENPEMGSESPVELGSEMTVCEVEGRQVDGRGAGRAGFRELEEGLNGNANGNGSGKRGIKARMSLFFDERSNLWVLKK